jgi:WD40 repeat protein
MDTLSMPSNGVALCVVGEFVWIALGDGMILVWNISTRKIMRQFPSGHTKKITSLILIGQEVWSSGESGQLIAWDMMAFCCVKRIDDAHSSRKIFGITSVGVSKALTLSIENQLCLWNVTVS